MDWHDWLNVQRVLRMLAGEWNCPVWMARGMIRWSINRCWAKAVSDPEAKALWERYFPKGRPTPEQYILRLGQAQETGEEMPWLLKE